MTGIVIGLLVCFPLCLWIVLRSFERTQSLHREELSGTIKELNSHTDELISRHEQLIGHRYETYREFGKEQLEMIRERQEKSFAVDDDDLHYSSDEEDRETLLEDSPYSNERDVEIDLKDILSALGEPYDPRDDSE